MEYEARGKCHFCGQQSRWAIAGSYRAIYCPPCSLTTLEKWSVKAALWEFQDFQLKAKPQNRVKAA